MARAAASPPLPPRVVATAALTAAPACSAQPPLHPRRQYWAGIKKFLKYATAKRDVWGVTMSQLLVRRRSKIAALTLHLRRAAPAPGAPRMRMRPAGAPRRRPDPALPF